MKRGDWGEEQAAAWLAQNGFEVLERNFRTRFGELDIIAQKDGFLSFVEVKTRKNDRFAQARESVTPAKQERLRITAELWLQEHPTALQPRFDVLEVYGTAGSTLPPRFVLIENAF